MKARKIIFLDRDGTINYNPVYRHYIRKHWQFKFLPGVKEALRLLTDAGFDIFIVSNQTGVGRGLFTKEDLRKIDIKMHKSLSLRGAHIKKACYCVHHPDEHCDCRKPKTGLFVRALNGKKIDKKRCFMVGDTQRDIMAGENFGLKTIAVLSGYAKRASIKNWKAKPDFVTKNLLTAVKRIVLKGC